MIRKGLAWLDEGPLLSLAWMLGMAAFLFLAAVPVDILSQLGLAGLVLTVLLVLRRQNLRGIPRIFFLLVASYLSLRYLFWRTFNTLVYHDPLSLVFALAVYIAEIYGLTIFLLGVFVNINPLRREPVPLPKDPALLPSVDIMIPSYNEDPAMLEVTVLAARQVRYPGGRVQVHLLDDGGTLQKRHDAHPERAAAALARHRTLQGLCERLGAYYVTRERNEHAKAGNINSALSTTDGDLILILDADHVPTVDILEKTVGLFVQDPKLFLVQTPHFFINPDPIEKNLQVFGRMPSENEMFYSVIQLGLDFWNSSFFCGSAAVLRRRFLEEVGGIAGSTITEDAETALGLHARGYHSAYISRPMISGLQPETYTSFIVQRVRWAQGMVQIFLLKNPLRLKGLRVWQRLCYTSSSFFWFFAYARVIFLLAPVAYLVFGLHIYDATLSGFVAYGLPHIVATMLVTQYLFGHVRWAFVSELYELMQSLFSLPGILEVIRNPHAPSFMVTPKGEQLEEDFISRLSGRFYVIYLITLVALGAGFYRYWVLPEDRGVILITLTWELLNLMLLNAALGALMELRQRRVIPRMPADMTAQLFFEGHAAVSVQVKDLSAQGASLLVEARAFEPVRDLKHAEFLAFNPPLGKYLRPRVQIRNWRPVAGGQVAVGLEYVHMSQRQKAEAVVFAHGDSERWVRFQGRRLHTQGIGRSFFTLLLLGIHHAGLHFRLVIRITLGFLARQLAEMTRALHRFWLNYRERLHVWFVSS